ncbi:MAG: type II toxin-antitoxin system VapC family toxin [Gammaproteobacteria bacterium]|nr:type II toxin-antitoxin system VapC family toxin [Gammaproteobacteria bacterium]
MMLIVPDASVILKWVLPGPEEQDLAAALHLRDAAVQGEIFVKVPSLWLYEVGNTLARRFPGQAKEILEALMEFGMEEGPPGKAWLNQTLSLTQQFNVTFYDAAYHALALVENGLFVTADYKYAQKTGPAGAVISLQDYTTLG